MSPNPTDAFLIRKARETDCPAIASLTEQLGYPSSSEATCERLKHILVSERDTVFLAHLPDKWVIGWIHAYLTTILETDPYAEIGGLIVDESCRREGIGRLLIEQAERWAAERGCRAVSVRSNVVREGAHSFYPNVGYRMVKTQTTFRKDL